MVSSSRVVASGWMEGSIIVSVARQRHSVIKGILTCGGETQKNTHVSKVVGRKESIRLINDNLKQNNRRGEIIAQCYGMVKILCAGSGYSGLNSGVKGRDKGERK